MILKVFRGAVIVVAAGTIGRGPLEHHVPSGPVFRLPGTQKPNILDKLCKNHKVPPMDELSSLLGARNGKHCRNLTTKIWKSGNFGFPKLGPARLWDIEGVVGCAETCSLQSPRASRTASSPFVTLCNSHVSLQ